MNTQSRFLIVFLSGFTCFACASNSESATVYVRIDQSVPGEFQVLARASFGDNFGIVAYTFPLTGAITSVDHLSPNTPFANFSTGSGPAGFTAVRSADGDTFLNASQDFTVSNGIIIRGFGQEDSSFVELGITPLAPAEQPDWGVPLLIARGTASGPVGVDLSTVDSFAKVVTTANGAPVTQTVLIVLVPEPASAVILGLAYAGLGIAGRHWSVRRSRDRHSRI